MKALVEEYKGIKFVRISSLPKEQRESIQANVSSNMIIKILKEGTILNDCLQYDHYTGWYEKIYRAKALENSGKLDLPFDKWAIAS